MRRSQPSGNEARIFDRWKDSRFTPTISFRDIDAPSSFDLFDEWYSPGGHGLRFQPDDRPDASTLLPPCLNHHERPASAMIKQAMVTNSMGDWSSQPKPGTATKRSPPTTQTRQA
jgi:hypothetical protein